jgi:hypothetical protein
MGSVHLPLRSISLPKGLCGETRAPTRPRDKFIRGSQSKEAEEPATRLIISLRQGSSCPVSTDLNQRIWIGTKNKTPT